MASVAPAIVHVHGGSILLDHLAAAGIPGERLEWCDPLCAGPAPAGVTGAAWYRLRAEYLAQEAGAPAASGDIGKLEDRLRDQDRALEAIPATTEAVIWAGPELFCQTVLMRLLVLLGQRQPRPPISLVDPGDQPGDKGCGLGNLDAQGLRAAFARRRPIGDAELRLAARAWAAFTAPVAAPLVALVRDDPRELPHLSAALARHLQDLPDGATGLSTTETWLLQALESAPQDRAALLRELAAREARPWVTDSRLDEILRRLSGSDRPGAGGLVEESQEPSTPAGQLSLTRRGHDVLLGYDFWNAERWHGGIRIGRDQDPAAPDDQGH